MAWLEMPGLACPFKEEISGYADAVERQVVDWARRLGLPQADDRRDQARRDQGGPAEPHARRREASLPALELLADWQMWLFLFDDQYSDESATGADLEQAKPADHRLHAGPR